MKTLVLGLGNEILSDDGVGIAAARMLMADFAGRTDVDVLESSLGGLALLDVFLGYQRAVVIDGIRTGNHPAGSLIELRPDDLDAVIAPSPHYAGFPEMLALAERLELDFPQTLHILAIETEDPYRIGCGLSDSVRSALPRVVARVHELLRAEPARLAPTEVDHA